MYSTKPKLLFIILLLFYTTTSYTRAQPAVRALWSIGNVDGDDKNQSVSFTRNVVDPAGNLITTGFFSGQIDLDNDAAYDLEAKGLSDLFMASYAPDGKVNWAIRAGSDADSLRDAGLAIALGKENTIYLLGVVHDVTDFNEDGQNDIAARDTAVFFMANYQLDGTMRWIKPIVTPYAWMFEYDGSRDELVIAGAHYSRCEAMGVNDCTGLFGGIAIQRYDSAGQLLFEKRSPDTYPDSTSYVNVTDATLAPNGDTYVAGLYQGIIDLDGPGGYPSFSSRALIYGYGAFYARYNAIGDLEQINLLCATGCAPPRLPVSVDKHGNVYLAGWMKIANASDSLVNVDIAKFDPDGGLIWGRKFIGTEINSFFIGTSIDLDIDDEDRVYLTGLVTGDGDLDEDGVADLEAGANHAAFAARFSPEGKLEWSHVVKHIERSNSSSQSQWIIATTDGDTFYGGSFIGDIYQDGAGPLPVISVTEQDHSNLFFFHLTSSSYGVSIETLPEANVISIINPYPNPFRFDTSFTLSIESTQQVQINLYDMLGRRVQSIFKGSLEANTAHQFVIDGSGLPSGTYIYRVDGQSFTRSERVTLIK